MDQDSTVFRCLCILQLSQRNLCVGIVIALSIRVFIARSLIHRTGWLCHSAVAVVRIRGIRSWRTRRTIFREMNLQWEGMLFDAKDDWGWFRIQMRAGVGSHLFWRRFQACKLRTSYCTGWIFTTRPLIQVTLWCTDGMFNVRHCAMQYKRCRTLIYRILETTRKLVAHDPCKRKTNQPLVSDRKTMEKWDSSWGHVQNSVVIYLPEYRWYIF